MDPIKNYLSSKLHFRLLRSVALNAELEFNKMNTQLFESDVQSYMDDFLRLNLKNTAYYPQREAFGKTDVVIIQNSRGSNGRKELKPVVLFEIKTAFKKHEKFSNKKFIELIKKDFSKLKQHKQPGLKAFFVLVFRTSKVPQAANDDVVFNVIHRKLANQISRNHISVGTEGGNVIVRPSYKCIVDNTTVLSWEILR